MRLDISNRTLFRYDAPVAESHNEVRACPVSDHRQNLVAYRLSVSPTARTMAYNDYWGTRVDAFGVREPHLSLEIVAEAAVDTFEAPPMPIPCAWEVLEEPWFRDRHHEYLEPTPHVGWGDGVDAAGRDAVVGDDVVATIVGVHDLVRERLEYEAGSTHIGIAVEDVLSEGTGVCQDFAHLAVALCRSVGVPARYVSGYLFTSSDRTGEDVVGDIVHVQTHAWFEAAVPGWGWLALDPTNGHEVGVRHVKIGHGRDYDDVPPLRGSISGGAEAEAGTNVEIRRMDPTQQAAVVQPPVTMSQFDHLPIQSQQQQQQQ
ncbi:MAG: transglutaminase family protein [Actinobacteria bacterium]|nr:transglutaminase family protein [Actinomycetota bacterium]